MISDGSIPNGEDDNEADEENKYDSYVNMELGLQIKDYDGLMHTIVKRRKLDDEGNDVGNMNNNPLIDTRSYEVEFADVTTEVLTVTIIAKNLLAQFDEEDHLQMILNENIDLKQDVNDIGKEGVFTKTPNGMKRRKMTTSGWQLYIQWKDRSTDWVALKEVKKSYLVELEDYTKRTKIDDEPEFAWWVPYVQKKREIILSKVKSKYWKWTHKYGIRLPNSVKEAYELYEENKNNLWWKGIEEEMAKLKAVVA